MRRSKGKKGVSVTFTADMNITVSKEDFLTNNLNKKQFVSLLSRQLESTGSKVFMAKADADLLIVNKAIEAAETRNTVLVGDDTDLLVLLLHHLLPIENKIYFAPQPKKIQRAVSGTSNKFNMIWGRLLASIYYFCMHFLAVIQRLGSMVLEKDLY